MRSPQRLPTTEITNIALEFIEDLEKFAKMAAMLVIGSLLTLDILNVAKRRACHRTAVVIRPLAVFLVTGAIGHCFSLVSTPVRLVLGKILGELS